MNGFTFIKNETIEKVFYFFPDPWVKKRHYKRRAFSAELLGEIHRVLKPGGKLYLMTDVPEVDEFQQKVLKDFGKFEFSYADSAAWDLPVKTNHEIFCEGRKIPFVRIICVKQ